MHRTLIDLPWLHLSSYYGMMLLGFLAATILAVRIAPRFGVTRRHALILSVVMLIAGWTGSKIVAQVVAWDQYFTPCFAPELLGLEEASCGPLLRFWEAGLVWYGAVIGTFLAGALVVRFLPYGFRDLSDLVAPCASLGHAFGRVGCFLTGCCFGRVHGSFPAVRFPTGTGPWAVHQAQWPELAGKIQASLPIHPVQLYEVVAELFILTGLLWLMPRRRYGGQLFLTYVLVYSLVRFVLEFFRGDPDRGYIVQWEAAARVGSMTFVEVTGLSVSQAVAIPLAIGAGVALFLLRKRDERLPAASSSATAG